MKIRPASAATSKAFTLIEMLTVISVTAILAILATPALQSLQKAGLFDNSVYGMADSLNLARAYAIANNTYVYVGVTELDRSQNPAATPQLAGIGRVAMSIVATTDGTSDAASWSTTGSNLTQVRQVRTFDLLHIASKAFPVATSGNMAFPANVTTTPAPLPAASSPLTPFSLPLGSDESASSGKYNFNNTNTQVICFTPEGGVLLNGTAVQWLEIDIQPAMGTSAPAAPTNVNQGNQAVLIIDGVTGAVTVYRP
jgi:prepilin-type N-terminal cleavage/methylation domain-containing protein